MWVIGDSVMLDIEHFYPSFLSRRAWSNAAGVRILMRYLPLPESRFPTVRSCSLYLVLAGISDIHFSDFNYKGIASRLDLRIVR